MKKLLTVLMLTLSLNFLALAGGVAYLFGTGALNKEKVAAIKLMLGPATTQAAAAGAEKKDQTGPATQPTIAKLEELLASVSGRPAGEQVEFMQRTFDAQMAQIDRRQHKKLQTLKDLVQVDRKLQEDRQKMLDARQKKLDEKEQAFTKDMTDKGFTESLALYDSMPAKQLKDVLLGMNDATATKYLRAMEPTRAAKILKEFKLPTETERMQRIVAMLRGTQADAKAN